MHVAAAMRTPVVALFGPTNPERHLPPADKMKVICRRELPCHPCYSTTCKIKTHACMKDISAMEVFREVNALIQNKA